MNDIKISNNSKFANAWILHREDISTVDDGVCNAYALLDASSLYGFGVEVAIEEPSDRQIKELLHSAYHRLNHWPNRVIIDKADPYVSLFKKILAKMNLELVELIEKELYPYICDFSKALWGNMLGDAAKHGFTDSKQEEIKAFLPKTYAQCP